MQRNFLIDCSYPTGVCHGCKKLPVDCAGIMLTKRASHAMLTSIEREDRYGFFCNPVDPVQSSAPNYFKIIREPMDLGTIKDRLSYASRYEYEDFVADMLLVWCNAITYNKKGHVVHEEALRLYSKFVEKLSAVLPPERMREIDASFTLVLLASA